MQNKFAGMNMQQLQRPLPGETPEQHAQRVAQFYHEQRVNAEETGNQGMSNQIQGKLQAAGDPRARQQGQGSVDADAINKVILAVAPALAGMIPMIVRGVAALAAGSAGAAGSQLATKVGQGAQRGQGAMQAAGRMAGRQSGKATVTSSSPARQTAIGGRPALTGGKPSGQAALSTRKALSGGRTAESAGTKAVSKKAGTAKPAAKASDSTTKASARSRSTTPKSKPSQASTAKKQATKAASNRTKLEPKANKTARKKKSN